GPCVCCRQIRWWAHPDGVWMCGVCRPPLHLPPGAVKGLQLPPNEGPRLAEGLTDAERYGFGANQILYEDPPWRFQNWSMDERAVRGEKWMRRNGGSDYDVMDRADLLALPIDKLAAQDCVRFTWATFPKLKEAIEYVEAPRKPNGQSIFTYK